jgi:hypothetical protein
MMVLFKSSSYTPKKTWQMNNLPNMWLVIYMMLISMSTWLKRKGVMEHDTLFDITGRVSECVKSIASSMVIC